MNQYDAADMILQAAQALQTRMGNLTSHDRTYSSSLTFYQLCRHYDSQDKIKTYSVEVWKKIDPLAMCMVQDESAQAGIEKNTLDHVRITLPVKPRA